MAEFDPEMLKKDKGLDLSSGVQEFQIFWELGGVGSQYIAKFVQAEVISSLSSKSSGLSKDNRRINVQK